MCVVRALVRSAAYALGDRTGDALSDPVIGGRATRAWVRQVDPTEIGYSAVQRQARFEFGLNTGK
jgi:hypothetical protein